MILNFISRRVTALIRDMTEIPLQSIEGPSFDTISIHGQNFVYFHSHTLSLLLCILFDKNIRKAYLNLSSASQHHKGHEFIQICRYHIISTIDQRQIKFVKEMCVHNTHNNSRWFLVGFSFGRVKCNYVELRGVQINKLSLIECSIVWIWFVTICTWTLEREQMLQIRCSCTHITQLTEFSLELVM